MSNVLLPCYIFRTCHITLFSRKSDLSNNERVFIVRVDLTWGLEPFGGQFVSSGQLSVRDAPLHFGGSTGIFQLCINVFSCWFHLPDVVDVIWSDVQCCHCQLLFIPVQTWGQLLMVTSHLTGYQSALVKSFLHLLVVFRKHGWWGWGC